MRKAFAIVVIGLLAAACGGGGKAKPSLSASPILSPPASPSGTPANCTDESKGAVFDLTQRNTAFAPSCLKVRSEQSIHIVNEDPILHNFSITGTGIDVDIQPGKTFNGESPGLKPGTYQFFCKYHKSLGMVGTIVVT